jgi:altronate hydrolase
MDAAPLLQIHRDDNVAVALRPLRQDEKLSLNGIALTPLEDVPQGHKIALQDLSQGKKVIKYGYPIGAASQAIKAGSWVHTHNLRTLLAEDPVYDWRGAAARNAAAGESAAIAAASDIRAYRRKDGRLGIRNEIWIIPTVGCVNQIAETLARWGQGEFCVGGNADSATGAVCAIDGVYAWTHPYGCSQMGDDHEATRNILAGLAQHPNAAAVLVIALGCENNTVESFKELLGPYAQDTERMAFLVAQDSGDEITEGRRLLARLADYAGKARRETAKLSELTVGMKCGGSDGLSGITANALVGRVCDTLCAQGAGVILTEVPEMFGAEQILMDRCATRELFDKTVGLIENFKAYYRAQGQVIYENPSPGNKAGGISTLEEKSLGCVQKGGRSPVLGVYRYGERIAGRGLALLEGPGNDMVSTTALSAAGAQLILFTTGRGSPLGSPAPVIKIASNTTLARQKPKWIDFDAGRLLTEDQDAVCADLMHLNAKLACGELRTRNEELGYREIAIFKNGVTL